MRRLGLAALAAGLVLAAPAAAADVPLNWKEHTTDGNGHVVMTFQVHGLAFDKTGWAAAITFTNLSKRTVYINPDFGLALYRTKQPGGRPARFLAATRTDPQLPARLGPGKRWRGAIGGPGTPPVGMYVRVVFGHYRGVPVKGFANGFIWITDHVYRMTKPSGPVA
jgi:hypothetical protein